MNPPKRYDRGTRGRISLPASDSSFRYFKSAPTSICSQDHKSVFWKSYNEVRNLFFVLVAILAIVLLTSEKLGHRSL